MRYLMVDRIDEVKKFAYAVGVKCISLSDDCFEHHFPGQPVYPGALLTEAMAQLGGALIELSLRDTTTPCPRCVVSTVKAKYREFVRPGDRLMMKAEIVSRHEESAKVAVLTTRDGQRVCEAEFLFVFLRIDDSKLESARMDLLDLLTRNTRFH